jgi:hypothetical protein
MASELQITVELLAGGKKPHSDKSVRQDLCVEPSNERKS